MFNVQLICVRPAILELVEYVNKKNEVFIDLRLHNVTELNAPEGLGGVTLNILFDSSSVECLENSTEHALIVVNRLPSSVRVAGVMSSSGTYNTTLCTCVFKLIGSAKKPTTVNISLEVLTSWTGEELVVEVVNKTFLRGDANGDGVVNVIDALWVVRYVAWQIGPEDLALLNAASPFHDSPRDRIDVLDALWVVRYVAWQLDEYFNPISH